MDPQAAAAPIQAIDPNSVQLSMMGNVNHGNLVVGSQAGYNVGGVGGIGEHHRVAESIGASGLARAEGHQSEFLGVQSGRVEHFAIGAGGVQAGGAEEVKCCGTTLFQDNFDCKNGCCQCGCGVLGQNCQCDVKACCEPVICCIPNTVKCCIENAPGCLSGVADCCSLVGDCLKGTLDLAGDLIKTILSACPD